MKRTIDVVSVLAGAAVSGGGLIRLIEYSGEYCVYIYMLYVPFISGSSSFSRLIKLS